MQPKAAGLAETDGARGLVWVAAGAAVALVIVIVAVLVRGRRTAAEEEAPA